MSNVWFTADTHFGHANIIKYCLRPFLSVEERERAISEPRGRWKVSRATVERHDQSILDEINRLVQSDDQLWVLGDFCWGHAEEAKGYLDRIACKNVSLVWGNHDHRSIGGLFQRTIEQGELSVEGQSIWLNHYPMRSWDKKFHGSWHLYGHVHDRLSQQDREQPESLTKDVGVDACEYRPMSFRDLMKYMKPRMQAFEEVKSRIVRGEASQNDRLD